MNTATFSLSGVRAVLEHEAREAARQYSRALAVRNRELQKLRELCDAFAADCDQLEERLADLPPAEQLEELQRWRQALETSKASQERKVRAAHRRVQEALARLVAARRALAMLNGGEDQAQKATGRTRANKRRLRQVAQAALHPALRYVEQVLTGAGFVWN